jgi:hypothetical protein
MFTNLARCLSIGIGLILVLGVSTASAADRHMTLNAEVGGVADGTVDVLFRDFSDLGVTGDFACIENTIELQVTPDLSGQDLLSLYLNFNPALDITKLALYWTGAAMPDGPPGANTFPDSGDEPAYIAISPNGFSPSGGQQFDILAQWSPGMSFSKLLLVYDNAETDIGFQDVFVTSERAPFFTGPSFGPLQAAGALAGPEGQGTVAAIPEPGAFVMLAAGLLALGFAARRRKA